MQAETYLFVNAIFSSVLSVLLDPTGYRRLLVIRTIMLLGYFRSEPSSAALAERIYMSQ
jgi:hypothetical protein